MLTHFLDHHDIQRVAFEGKNQAIKPGQVHGVLTPPFAFQLVASKPWQAFYLLKAVGCLDKIDPLNVLAGDILPERLDCLF